MAVPASGNSISLAGLAAEKDVDDYTDADYDDVLSLKDITIGGNNNGNSFVVDATNAFSVSHPDNVAPFRMSEFYSYDHDFNPFSSVIADFTLSWRNIVNVCI